MKIAHVTPVFVPGMGYQENYLPWKQMELGHDVSIITSTASRFQIYQNDKNIPDSGVYDKDGIKVHRLKTLAEFESIGRIVISGLERKLREVDPDIVHSHEFVNTSNIRSCFFAFHSDANLFIDVHIDNDNFHLDNMIKRLGFSGFKKMFLPNINKVTDNFLPVNPYAEWFLKQNTGIPTGKIERLPLGVDKNVFCPSAKERRKKRRQLAIDRGQPLIVTAGNIDRTKDIDILLQAFADIDRDNAHLIIVGDGPPKYMQSLRQIVNCLDIGGSVDFLDPVPHDELSQYYNAADIGVWPGKFGITIIEAIATGLPSVVSQNRATDLVLQNDNGLSFQRGAADELRDLIERYLSNSTLRSIHSENGIELVNDHLSWESIAEKSIQIYEQN